MHANEVRHEQPQTAMPPSAEDRWNSVASDVHANWKLDAVESLLGDYDVDLQYRVLGKVSRPAARNF